MSWAAQIEEIDASKPAGSSTSAGIRFFRSSAVVSRSVEVIRSWLGPGDGDGRREGGVENLTTGFWYRRGRLCGVALTIKT